MTPADRATSYLPPVVQRVVDDLRAGTGQEPVVERPQDRRWRVTMANDRVHMTVDYKITSGGRCTWTGSVLVVDGERRPLAKDLDHFLRIFRDPDNELHKRDPEVPPLSVQLDPRPVADAPTQIRQVYEGLVGQLPDAVEVTVGTPAPGFWAIQVQSERAHMRANFRLRDDPKKPRRAPRWQLDRAHPIQLCVDGQDLTEHAEGKLDRALALFVGTERPPTPVAPAIRTASPPARSIAVETRRATVIRT